MFVFSHTYPVPWGFIHPMLWELHGFLLHAKYSSICLFKYNINEINNEASTSLINYEIFVKLYGNNARINPTSSRIRNYTGEFVKPKGSTECRERSRA